MSSNKAAEISVHKVTLGSGKVVLLREPKIKHQELALSAVAEKAGGNQMLAATLAQKELVKMLIVQVDGKAPNNQEKEDLDGLFSLREYGQLVQVLGKLTGDDLGNFQIEFVASGGE